MVQHLICYSLIITLSIILFSYFKDWQDSACACGLIQDPSRHQKIKMCNVLNNLRHLFLVVQSNEMDVLDEAQRVSNPGCQDSVKATNISKVYANGFSAVKGTSFGIERKQVFGLLGPNGAGKSTTFNILTSRIKPSTGNIYLLN